MIKVKVRCEMTNFKYFFEDEKYGNPYKDSPVFKENTLYQYVPSSVLNGVINHVQILSANVISRYAIPDNEATDDTNELTRSALKRKVKEFNEKEAEYHTNLDQFGDDVLILGYIEDNETYWYFWFDQDVSDCFIGMFQTVIKQEEVINSYKEYIKTLPVDTDCHETYSLNLDNIRGWVSF